MQRAAAARYWARRWFWVGLWLGLGAGVSWAQPYDRYAVFICDGPLFETCDGSGSLISPDESVFVYWDWDCNGPDSTDILVCAPGLACIPEYAAGNFADFFLDDSGRFTSPAFAGWFMPWYNCDRFFVYLRIFTGPGNTVAHTSPVAELRHTEVPDTIRLDAAGWTCEAWLWEVPWCTMSPTDLFVDWDGTGVVEHCVGTCDGGLSWIWVNYAEGLDIRRPPVLSFAGNCDDSCARIGSVSWSPNMFEFWIFPDHWLTRIQGLSRGCVTVSILPEAPTARIDSFWTVGLDYDVELHWIITEEHAAAEYNVWRTRPYGGIPPLAGTVTANPEPGPHHYYMVDSTHGYSHGYLFGYLLAVTDSAGPQYPLWGMEMIPSDWLGAPEPPVLALPRELTLHPNFPNPFNATTRITFDLPSPMAVKLEVLNLLGQSVTTLIEKPLRAGSHAVSFDGHALSSGVYVYHLRAGAETRTGKMLLIR